MGNAHYRSQSPLPNMPRAGTRVWLEARQADLLPVPCFHVIFITQEPITAIASQNKRVVYDILFRSIATTLRTEPEVGAVCGKAACTNLCGGREVTGVLTTTSASLLLDTKRHSNSAVECPLSWVKT